MASTLILNHTDVFRVVTFNLKSDAIFALNKKTSWVSRKNIAMQIIKESGASVVGVQELLPHMRDDIHATLDGYSIFGIGRFDQRKGEHSDIIIKDEATDIIKHNTFWLSKYPTKMASRAYYAIFPRICTVAEIYIREAQRKVRVFNTHFDHICGPARTLGVRTILRYLHELQEVDPMPSIIMGDLNAKPFSKPVRILRDNLHGYDNIHLIDAFYYCNRDYAGINTYHGFKGKQNNLWLDYIFVTDDLEPVSAYVEKHNEGGVYPSDHYPLVATLRFKEK